MAAPAVKKMASSSEWGLTFPNDLDIEKSSGIFAQRMISVVTAFILDKRSLLGEECFKTRIIEKLLVSTFNRENPNAKRLFVKLESLKSAIHDKFLREFALVFYKAPNEEDILEVYTFRLSYNEGEVLLSLDTGIGSEAISQNLLNANFENLEQTKTVFVNTMKKLHRCMKSLDDLPEDADAGFRISFTDDAPKDYMPQGFVESDEFYKLDPSVQAFEMGTMCAKYHKIQIVAASQLIKHGRNVDLNQTSVSMNQSILNTPSNKRKAPEGPQKKQSEKRTRPFGQTGPIATPRRRAQQQN